MTFFTRIDGLSLEPGNKTAGFTLCVSVSQMRELCKICVTSEERNWLQAQVHLRLKRAELLPEELLKGSGVLFCENTAVPRCFILDPCFGGSIGIEPSLLEFLPNDELADALGTECYYYPHNVDSPREALALLVVIQTWSEWAWGKLLTSIKSGHPEGRKSKGKGDGR